jgi:hypothetical protein
MLPARLHGAQQNSHPSTMHPLFKDLAGLFGSSLEGIIKRVERRLREHLAPRGYTQLEVHHFGAIDLHPRHLVICVCVGTDAERQQIIDSNPATLIRTWLAEEGYPQDATPHIAVSIDSQETVDRDWKGDWHQYYQ